MGAPRTEVVDALRRRQGPNADAMYCVLPGVAPLLLKISEEITDCVARADEARQRALHETDERLKGEWLDIEHRWRHLAESLKFVEIQPVS
jgi:hypothetical protein